MLSESIQVLFFFGPTSTDRYSIGYRFDSDKSGFITKENLRDVFKGQLEVSEEKDLSEFERMLEEAGCSERKGMDLNGFSKMVKNPKPVTRVFSSSSLVKRPDTRSSKDEKSPPPMIVEHKDESDRQARHLHTQHHQTGGRLPSTPYQSRDKSGGSGMYMYSQP